MAAGGLHISISAEKIFSIGPLVVSNSILTSLVATGLIVFFAFLANRSLAKNNKENGHPRGLQNFVEFVYQSFYDLVQNVTNDRGKTLVFLPFVVAFFWFILVNNLLGLIPGVGTVGFYEEAESSHQETTEEHSEVSQSLLVGSAQASTQTDVEQPVVEVVTTQHQIEAEKTAEDNHLEVDGEELGQGVEGNQADHQVGVAESNMGEHSGESSHQVFVPLFRAGTADLNTTIALAIISIALTQVIGFKYLGLSYLKKYINFSSPIMFFVGVLELISEFAKIISFAFRLFGNIFAGEVLLAVITFLVPIIAPMPFYGLEIFVGFIQAFVFSLLSLVFFKMAADSHEEH
ncbi:MAG: F0F1 ATP synthase subunit A [Patescibacteria group bacterium]